MHQVIIDCDPGVDDAVAILYGAAHLDVLGITTVAGNVPVDRAAANALSIVELAGLSIPVARGMQRAWIQPPVRATEVHGETGLNGPLVPAPRREPVGRHGVEFIIEHARSHPGLVLVALGPLTNIATALRLEPRLAQWVRGISMMGGSTGPGNITPAAEFNVHCDPEAAHAVFTSGIPIWMAGLNVTEQVVVDEGQIDRLRQSGRRTARAMAEVLAAHRERVREEFGLSEEPLHDVCALAPLVAPDFITYRPMPVTVELSSPVTRGMTVCDQRPGAADAPGDGPLPHVAVSVRASDLVEHVLETIMSYP